MLASELRPRRTKQNTQTADAKSLLKAELIEQSAVELLFTHGEKKRFLRRCGKKIQQRLRGQLIIGIEKQRVCLLSYISQHSLFLHEQLYMQR